MAAAPEPARPARIAPTAFVSRAPAFEAGRKPGYLRSALEGGRLWPTRARVGVCDMNEMVRPSDLETGGVRLPADHPPVRSGASACCS
jgi:hypothetical protein